MNNSLQETCGTRVKTRVGLKASSAFLLCNLSNLLLRVLRRIFKGLFPYQGKLTSSKHFEKALRLPSGQHFWKNKGQVAFHPSNRCSCKGLKQLHISHNLARSDLCSLLLNLGPVKLILKTSLRMWTCISPDLLAVSISILTSGMPKVTQRPPGYPCTCSRLRTLGLARAEILIVNREGRRSEDEENMRFHKSKIFFCRDGERASLQRSPTGKKRPISGHQQIQDSAQKHNFQWIQTGNLILAVRLIFFQFVLDMQDKVTLYI